MKKTVIILTLVVIFVVSNLVLAEEKKVITPKNLTEEYLKKEPAIPLISLQDITYFLSKEKKYHNSVVDYSWEKMADEIESITVKIVTNDTKSTKLTLPLIPAHEVADLIKNKKAEVLSYSWSSNEKQHVLHVKIFKRPAVTE